MADNLPGLSFSLHGVVVQKKKRRDFLMQKGQNKKKTIIAVVAALVLCEGADSLAVRQRVVSMISSLYGIGTHRIEVVKISN